MKSFLTGFLVAIFSLGSTGAVLAEPVTKNVEVVFEQVEIILGPYVNKETVLIDGKTYLPLRDVAQVLNMDVVWDESTNTASLVPKSTNKSAYTDGVKLVKKDLFELMLPSGWKEVSTLNEYADFQAFNLPKNAYMIDMVEPKQDYIGDINDRMEEIIADISVDLIELSSSEKTVIKVNGDPAVCYIYSGLFGNYWITYKIVTIEHEDYFSILSFWSSKSQFDKADDDFDFILNSYKFKGSDD